jgi:hypothetical protein
MLKKYISHLILKNCTAEWVWTGQVEPEKFNLQAGQTGIFRSGGMDRAG